jgi:hypothetical protein
MKYRAELPPRVRLCSTDRQQSMGPSVILWNATKREHISFVHIGSASAREVAGNPVSAAIVTWYLLQNVGDQISLQPAYDAQEAANPVYDEGIQSPDLMDQVVAALIDAGIVKDEGFSFRDETEPDSVYVRDIRSIWME